MDETSIPHWAPPTHAMQIWRYAEQGSIELLWISCHEPGGVACPTSRGCARILEGDSCFVVVQDAFLTETARLADVVLPAAGWGEKTGTFTNVNRTVHLSEKAVDPPGQAKPTSTSSWRTRGRWTSATRTAAPLVTWSTPEEAFEAWKACSKGRPCDYTGLSYERAARPVGHPVAGERRAPRRHRAAVRRRRLPDRHRLLRDLRPRPAHRGRRDSREARGREPRGPGGAARRARTCRRWRSPTTSTRCGSSPAAPSTTSTPAPRPGARAAARGRGARRLGRAGTPRTPRRSGSPTATSCEVESRRGAIGRAGADRAAPAARGDRLRAVPLRLLGRGRGRRPATASARGPPTS